MAESKATFGRKWLAGILRNDDLSPEEKEQQIMDGHIAVTDGLKDRIEGLKEEADKVPALQKQLDEKDGGEDWKAKYEKEHSDFEAYKLQISKSAELEEIKALHGEILRDLGINADRIKAIQKVTDYSGMKKGKDGKLADEAAVRKAVSEEWKDFIPTNTNKGAKVENPPAAGKTAGKTMEEIMAMKDPIERQKAIMENREQYGI